MFDPNKSSGGGGGGTADELLPAGEYLLAITWLQLKTTQSGSTLARVKATVCAGPFAGKAFFTAIFLDLSKDGSRARLEMLCKSAGITAPFDVDSERSVKAALMNKPFKVRVERKTETDKRDGTTREVNDIARYVVKLSPEDQKAARGWVLDRAEAEAARGGGGGGGQSHDDDGLGGGGGGAQDNDFADDDIPF